MGRPIGVNCKCLHSDSCVTGTKILWTLRTPAGTETALPPLTSPQKPARAAPDSQHDGVPLRPWASRFRVGATCQCGQCTASPQGSFKLQPRHRQDPPPPRSSRSFPLSRVLGHAAARGLALIFFFFHFDVSPHAALVCIPDLSQPHLTYLIDFPVWMTTESSKSCAGDCFFSSLKPPFVC